jgi:hypothetical protein
LGFCGGKKCWGNDYDDYYYDYYDDYYDDYYEHKYNVVD